MKECRHKKSCSPNCPLYVTKEEFKEEYEVHCVLEAIWDKLENLEPSGDEDHSHDEFYEIEDVKRRIERTEGKIGKNYPYKY